jgi:hypothetical protein
MGDGVSIALQASVPPHAADRIARWPFLIALGVPAAMIACGAIIGTDFVYVMLGIPALMLFWAAAGAFAIVVGVISARAGNWRKAASCFVLPALVLANAPAPLAFIHFCSDIGDTIHFEVMRTHYLSVVNSLPGTGQPKLAVFDWGGMVWASTGVVYDESDQLMLPPQKRTSDWVARASTTELACGGYRATPVARHFYIVDFPC